MHISSDILVLGTGVAGLSIAIKLAESMPDKSIHVVTKSEKEESNTRYAQGGVAAVIDSKDSIEEHIRDTLRAGDYTNDLEAVKKVVNSAARRIDDLINWGVSFDLNAKGSLDLGKEGGHTSNRILHYKDITGLEISRALLKKASKLGNIQFFQHHFAIDLITNHQLNQHSQANACYGVYAIDEKSGNIITFSASYTCIATGGAGQVYRYTTNPSVATGDGVAMAYRAGVEIRDMEFIQFHPTALYEPDVSVSFLISEAVRGFGAFLRDHNGVRFMTAYDDRAELASRDIVSRAIDQELKKSGQPHVYLDATHTDIEAFKKHFPNIYNKCLSKGIDVSKDYIPVVPAMHYVCGGIVADLYGKTSLSRLYACGEAACTGLHGANRLASNSLLEALVFSHEIATDIYKNFDAVAVDIPNWSEKGISLPHEKILILQNREEVRLLMSNYVAIVRSDERLKRALTRLDTLFAETSDFYKKSKVSVPLGELRNIITIANLIVKQSLSRTENKGAFYKQDLDHG